MSNSAKGFGYTGRTLLPGLVIILIGCLMGIALPAVPAQAACPAVALSPNSGVPGINIVVNGQNFRENAHVDIYYDGASIATGNSDMNGSFAITIAIPESCKGVHTVLVVVRSQILTVERETHFTVKPRLLISPEEGPVGTEVTVKGQGFACNETGIEVLYYLDGSYRTIQGNITANEKGSWQTTVTIPSSARGEHKLDARGARSKLLDVEDATFKVTTEISLDRLSGIVGESITVRGSRFAAYERGIRILFNGEAIAAGIQADSQGDWTGSFDVPEMTAGTYAVTAQGEQTREEDVSALNFKIEPGIVLFPDGGHVGTNLTATGRGFAASRDVVMKYEGSQVATARTNTTGSFVTGFVVPRSQYGDRQITAEDAARNKAAAIFTMESDPPDTPRLISPSSRAMVGFVGKVRPTFEWSEVSDESGVRYNLQIATSAVVTATGGFVRPAVSVEGIVGTGHLLEAAHALPYGTYYWIVQAVDGAENKGGWTAAGSFRAGLLPLWAFIAAIAAVAGGIIFLVIRSLLTKKRI